MEVLSRRLQQAIACLPDCEVIADIGCDHGYAALALVQTGKAKRVIACDISAPSLEKTRRLFNQHHRQEQVELFVCDGLARAEQAQAALIAGMGGHTITRILQKDAPIAHNLERLVLQPSDGVNVLRCFLAHNGYALQEETIVRDGRLYPILCVRYTGRPYALTPAQAYIGPFNLMRMDAETSAYIRWQMNILQKTYQTPATSERGRCMQRQNRHLAEQLAQLLPKEKRESVKR